MNSSLIYSSVNPEERFRRQESRSAFALGWATVGSARLFPPSFSSFHCLCLITLGKKCH